MSEGADRDREDHTGETEAHLVFDTTGAALARELDAGDPLRELRDAFHVPPGRDGEPVRYFVGNSLGLMPRHAERLIGEELEAWRTQAVDAHFEAARPWYSYHEIVRGSLAQVVGAEVDEVVAMNGLTVNLHLLMASFFRPNRERKKILIESPVFPSDMYAMRTQLLHHGLDPETDLIQVGPRETEGEHLLRTEDLEAAIEEHADSLAVVLLAGVNFLTGQLLDIQRLTEAAHEAGVRIGFDLAHAAGNVPLQLHEWNVDFAVWCSYKYLNAGPGSVAGAFVHQRHARDKELPRLGGWWGNDPETRFRMQMEPYFRPQPSADGWQLSNPSIFATAPLRASLDLFDRTGMAALRAKSERLTAYLEFLLAELCGDAVGVLTPKDPAARGCQLSLEIGDRAKDVHDRLAGRGVVCDFRQPDILRFAPVPLYNSFADVHGAVEVLAEVLAGAAT